MTTRSNCSCGFPAKWAADPNMPIAFDQKLNEFQLQNRSGGHWPIRYCPLCGGTLAESKRKEEAPQIDEREMAEVRALFQRNIRTAVQMKEILGDPDHIKERDNDPYVSQQFVRWYEYFKRWRTICLTFAEMQDGKLEMSFQGKTTE
ncbi:MAG: hypothetical protein NTY77_17350 [Elusimicrobia bacterium]|nr:hypothetical protein [Elusimicrobiota bacterium]